MIFPNELIIDLFAGGGGASTGIEAAKIRLIGNSVCPNVAKALIDSQFNIPPAEIKVAA